MEHYPSFKKKEILTGGITWMNLEDVLLSEVSKTQNNKYCMVLLQSSKKNMRERSPERISTVNNNILHTLKFIKG
jgi:hypothetical protein